MGRVATHFSPDPNNPQPAGWCDGCSQCWPLSKLEWQYEYYGMNLTKTGWRHCPNCLDVPNPSNMPPQLGPDPLPVMDPRPEKGGFAPDFIMGVAADDTAAGEQYITGVDPTDTVEGEQDITTEI